ncbi:MAG: ABC transporter permease [Anaerolineae bacterium]|jgi:putative ABC transport system permease protein|nr:ABC transporter permease [Anaerolineae bacterium]
MNLSESFLSALDTLAAHKLRSALTMLGVIIGVAAVIALMAIGNGVQSSITDEITSVGSNLIVVSPDMEHSGGYPPLSLADVEALADPLNAPAVSSVAASVAGNREVTAGGNSVTTSVSGVTANYFEVVNLGEFQAGDGLTQADVDTKARVVVLGASVASELFDGENPVGRMVKIDGASYEVVGVLAEQGQTLAGNPDENVYAPITTAQARLYADRTRTGKHAVSSITAQARSETEADAAIEQIEATLREAHGLTGDDESDFSTFSQTALLETVNTITATLTAFLGAIAGISLLVGGIGIMNIMLVSVTERTREIGVRKAIGALRRDILGQFLLESILMSAIGGLAGIALGWLLAQAFSLALDATAVVDAQTVLMATGFAAAVGLVFGLYPAWRASKLRPIEALRYE